MTTGNLLLAEPYLLDSNFRRSAIAVVDHHEDGTVGFVLNHPLDWRVSDVIDGFPAFDSFMGYGGPVQRDTLHFLHSVGDRLPESILVQENLWWGGDFERLTGLIDDGFVTPQDVRFFLGYSGWSEGQLKEELDANTWVVGALTNQLVFETPHDQVWPKAMRRLGNTYGVISEMDEESLN